MNKKIEQARDSVSLLLLVIIYLLCEYINWIHYQNSVSSGRWNITLRCAKSIQEFLATMRQVHLKSQGDSLFEVLYLQSHTCHMTGDTP